MGRLPGTGQLMVFSVEHHHPGRNPQVDQRGIKLVALRDGAAVVLLAVDDQRRGFGMFAGGRIKIKRPVS